MRKTESQKIALCGVLSALSVVVLLVGNVLQIGTYAAPMLASFLLIPVLEDYGKKYALLLYAVVSLLSLFLVPDKELVLFYQGVSLPFVASIVIGTIQLGATVDYAIVYTSRYLKERRNGKNKLEAVSIAHKSNMLSIITSALSLFAATYGVACYSQVDMIGSICTLLARGAVISMIVVLTLLPTMFLIFDKVICKTTGGMKHIDN